MELAVPSLGQNGLPGPGRHAQGTLHKSSRGQAFSDSSPLSCREPEPGEESGGEGKLELEQSGRQEELTFLSMFNSSFAAKWVTLSLLHAGQALCQRARFLLLFPSADSSHTVAKNPEFLALLLGRWAGSTMLKVSGFFYQLFFC